MRLTAKRCEAFLFQDKETRIMARHKGGFMVKGTSHEGKKGHKKSHKRGRKGGRKHGRK